MYNTERKKDTARCSGNICRFFKSLTSTLVSDDCKYTIIGEVKNNTLDGFGFVTRSQSYKDSLQFESAIGYFQNGSLIFGKMTCKKEHYSIFENIKEGNFVSNKLYGFGQITNSLMKQIGQFEQNQLVSGQIEFASGRKLRGHFKAQNSLKVTGIGVITNENSDVLEGQLLNGELDGRGRLTTIDGTIYEGDFSKSILTFGTQQLVDRIYVGKFKLHSLAEGQMALGYDMFENGTFNNDDLCQGKTITVLDNEIWDGQYCNGNLLNGQILNPDVMKIQIQGGFENQICKIQYSDNREIEGNSNEQNYVSARVRVGWYQVLEGVFAQKKLNGYGRLTYSDGVTKEGIFKDDQLIKGKKTYPGVVALKGSFQDEILCDGSIKFANNRVVQFHNPTPLPQFHGQSKTAYYVANDANYIIQVNYFGVCEGNFNEMNQLVHGRQWNYVACSEGHFVNDRLNGFGTKVFRHGMTWVGFFRDDCLIDGTVTFTDGRIINVSQNQNGPNAMTTWEGDVLEGTFINGHLVGKGKVTTWLGTFVEGEFSPVFENQLCGKYKVTFVDGTVYENDLSNPCPFDLDLGEFVVKEEEKMPRPYVCTFANPEKIQREEAEIIQEEEGYEEEGEREEMNEEM